MAKSIWEGRGGGAYNPLGPRAWAGLVHMRRSVIAHRVGERIDMTTRPAAIHLSSSPTIVSCASPRVTACREFAGPRDILAPAGGAVRPQWLRPGTAALGKGRRSGLRPRVRVCVDRVRPFLRGGIRPLFPVVPVRAIIAAATSSTQAFPRRLPRKNSASRSLRHMGTTAPDSASSLRSTAQQLGLEAHENRGRRERRGNPRWPSGNSKALILLRL